MELKQHLIPKLKHLRLSGILDTLDVRSQQALAEHWTYADFLERLLEDEVERRAQKQLALRVRRADLASDKTLELRHLHAGRADGSYEKRLAGYVRSNLLVIDDFGLKPLMSPGPEDLYDVINERYEKGSILITSNRAPSEWAGWFADPLLASAGLDRLAHNAYVLIITGASFRTHGREQLDKEVMLASATTTPQ